MTQPNAEKRWQRTLLGYGLTATTLVAGGLLRSAMSPMLGDDVPLVLLFPAVVVAALFLGTRAGLVTTAAACAIGVYFFIPPAEALLPLRAFDAFRALLFLVLGAVTTWLLASRSRAFQTAAAIAAVLREREPELQASLAAQRDAERALRESEARYRAVFEHPAQYTIVLEAVRDESGAIRDWIYKDANTAALGLLKTTREDLLGRSGSESLPQCGSNLHALCTQVAETQSPLRYEARYDGLDILTSMFPVGPGTVVSSGVDISERKQMERALRESEKQLREADRRKDEFLAVLGHELRNPLAPLITGMEILNRHEATPEAASAARAIMARQLSHLVRLVDDLLDTSRISRGKVNLERKPLDIHDVVTAGIDLARPAITQRGHRLVVDETREELSIHGDSQRLSQVLANLLTNAAKFTDPGGEIRVTTAKDGTHAVVVVRDSGYGIPAGRLEEIFEMFSQVPEHRTKTGGGGLGVGLALARKIVELHGGSLEARSDGLGTGSEFIARLPLAAAARTGPGAPRESHRVSRWRRVLIVDDNVDAAHSLQIALTLKGHTVQAVHDGPNALRVLETFAPDVILLDIGLPEIDGYEVARRIRASPAGRSVKLLAITGWGQEQDRRRARESGFDRHLTKPVEGTALDALIAG